MNKDTRNILITVSIILLVACVCIGVVAAVGTGFFMLKPQTPVVPTATVTLPTPVPTLTFKSGLSPDVAAQMDLIQSQVISLRKLEPVSAVPRTLLSTEQLRENVINDFLSEYTSEDAAKDARVLSILGLLPEDFDLLHFYTELYSEQIAGYYDDEAQAMYVVQGEAFAGDEKMTYAHEYVHVLQDQTYDFDGALGYTEEACNEDSERCAAIQSLIEGDATVTEMKWFQRYATQQDYDDIIAFYDSYQSPVYDSAPHYMQEDFTFAYVKGQAFVEYLIDQGGEEAVDAAYLNVPLSTEQILHPEKYPDDKPVSVDLADLTQTLGEGWEEQDRNVMGEWYTYLILAHGYAESTRLDDAAALKASAGWGGDTYLVYHNPGTDKYVFLMRSAWDSMKDVDEYYQALLQYAALRWGNGTEDDLGSQVWQADGASIAIYQEADQVTWIIAPDDATYRLIKSNLP